MRRSLILSAAVSTVALPAIARATFIAGDSYLLGANFTSGQYTASTPLKSQDATQTVSGFVTGP